MIGPSGVKCGAHGPFVPVLDHVPVATPTVPDDEHEHDGE